jgi:SM-20-related protein
MPDASFFTRFHLFAVPDFFDAGLCATLTAEMCSANRTPATVRQQGSEYTVDPGIRSAKWVNVSPATVSLTESRLLGLQPQLERHFDLPLAGCQEPQFLAYKPGDFYRRHRDSNERADASPIAQARRVSVVIFLNSESGHPEEGRYGGGSLTFYGLLDRPGGPAIGLPLTAQAGLLIAFRSSLLHEVTPVSHGERYTIVSWYY